MFRKRCFDSGWKGGKGASEEGLCLLWGELVRLKES